MCGCCSDAASWISRRKRSMFTAADVSGGSTLTTTLRPSAVSLREEHVRHSTAAELPLDAVGIAEGGLQSLDEF